MIISHKHKFIFIKTNKTAGTSIEIALSKYCGPDDVITKISKTDEAQRKELGGRGPQHFRAPLWDYSAKDWKNLFLRWKGKSRFYNHVSALEIRQHIDPEIWDKYYKFCFERNPWDRFISFYYWKCSFEPRPSISEFLESNVPQLLKRRGYQLYTINDEVVVDRICRFENLTDELETVRQNIGLPAPLELPRTKSGSRKDKQSYRDILTEKERDKIAELFPEEITLLGYRF